MEEIISNIISYLKYLNGECRLNVSVHFEHDIFERISESVVSKLIPYNCHTNAYCVMIKNIDHNKCLQNQKCILEMCREGKAFCHNCYASVSEYIYPILKDGEAVGFVSVSGYRPDNPQSENIVDVALWESTLKPEIPFDLCDAVIPPLCIMLEQMLYTYLREIRSELNFIIQFLNEYHTNVTLSDLAMHFNRSRSHISHLFKRESGMTLRAYCNNLKLEDARKLLLSTDLSVTTIALNVGFNDTSYFIYLFKKKYGIAPLQYRKVKG